MKKFISYWIIISLLVFPFSAQASNSWLINLLKGNLSKKVEIPKIPTETKLNIMESQAIALTYDRNEKCAPFKDAFGEFMTLVIEQEAPDDGIPQKDFSNFGMSEFQFGKPTPEGPTLPGMKKQKKVPIVSGNPDIQEAFAEAYGYWSDCVAANEKLEEKNEDIASELNLYWEDLNPNQVKESGDMTPVLKRAVFEFEGYFRSGVGVSLHSELPGIQILPQCSGDLLKDQTIPAYLFAILNRKALLESQEECIATTPPKDQAIPYECRKDAEANQEQILDKLKEFQRELLCLSSKQMSAVDSALHAAMDLTEEDLISRDYSAAILEFRQMLYPLALLLVDASKILGATTTYDWLVENTKGWVFGGMTRFPFGKLPLYDLESGQLKMLKFCPEPLVITESITKADPMQSFQKKLNELLAPPGKVVQKEEELEYPTPFGVEWYDVAENVCKVKKPSWHDHYKEHGCYPISAKQFIQKPINLGYARCPWYTMFMNNGTCPSGFCTDKMHDLAILFSGGGGEVADTNINLGVQDDMDAKCSLLPTGPKSFLACLGSAYGGGDDGETNPIAMSESSGAGGGGGVKSEASYISAAGVNKGLCGSNLGGSAPITVEEGDDGGSDTEDSGDAGDDGSDDSDTGGDGEDSSDDSDDDDDDDSGSGSGGSNDGGGSGGGGRGSGGGEKSKFYQFDDMVFNVQPPAGPRKQGPAGPSPRGKGGIDTGGGSATPPTPTPQPDPGDSDGGSPPPSGDDDFGGKGPGPNQGSGSNPRGGSGDSGGQDGGNQRGGSSPPKRGGPGERGSATGETGTKPPEKNPFNMTVAPLSDEEIDPMVEIMIKIGEAEEELADLEKEYLELAKGAASGDPEKMDQLAEAEQKLAEKVKEIEGYLRQLAETEKAREILGLAKARARELLEKGKEKIKAEMRKAVEEVLGESVSDEELEDAFQAAVEAVEGTVGDGGDVNPLSDTPRSSGDYDEGKQQITIYMGEFMDTMVKKDSPPDKVVNWVVRVDLHEAFAHAMLGKLFGNKTTTSQEHKTYQRMMKNWAGKPADYKYAVTWGMLTGGWRTIGGKQLTGGGFSGGGSGGSTPKGGGSAPHDFMGGGGDIPPMCNPVTQQAMALMGCFGYGSNVVDGSKGGGWAMPTGGIGYTPNPNGADENPFGDCMDIGGDGEGQDDCGISYCPDAPPGQDCCGNKKGGGGPEHIKPKDKPACFYTTCPDGSTPVSDPVGNICICDDGGMNQQIIKQDATMKPFEMKGNVEKLIQERKGGASQKRGSPRNR